MIEIRPIDAAHRGDLLLPNEPFALFGRLRPRYADGRWDYTTERFAQPEELCFPDEDYDYDALAGNGVLLGAYEGARCIGLAILQRGMFRYLYLSDLKVCADRRRSGAARRLIEAAKAAAADMGLRGIYCCAQDDNLGACLFYLRCGFRIGGLDTELYRGTKQEGRADIAFYLDC